MTDRDQSLTYYRKSTRVRIGPSIWPSIDSSHILHEILGKGAIQTYWKYDWSQSMVRSKKPITSNFFHSSLWNAFCECCQNLSNFVVLKKKRFCWRSFIWNYTDSQRMWCSGLKLCLFNFELQICRCQRQQVCSSVLEFCEQEKNGVSEVVNNSGF